MPIPRHGSRSARLARRGRVVLLFGAKDEAHNNAVALKDYLERKLD